MAATSETFSLASRPVGASRITSFLVKVTDSGLKSLNDALKKPTRGDGWITFSSSDGGHVTFDPASGKSFKFTLSDSQKDVNAKGSLEAVEQFASHSRWQKIGLTRYRATIMATDDSYQSTKRKAIQAEEDAKKVAAKVLKQPKAAGATKASAKMWRRVYDTASAITSRPLTPVANCSTSTLSGAGRAVVPANAAQSKGLDIRKKSLRERIIHHLLVSPSSVKELLNRMLKEGLSPEERLSFNSTFDAVAQPKSQSSSGSDEAVYELKAQCLSEVNDDWPFYSSWHRQVAKRTVATRLSPFQKGKELSIAQLIPARKNESTKSRPSAGPSQSGKRGVALDKGGQEVDKCTQRLAEKSSSSEAVGCSATKMRRADINPEAKAKMTTCPVKSNGHGVSDTSSASKGAGKSSSTPERKRDHHHQSTLARTASPDKLSFWDEFPDIDTLAERSRYKEKFDQQYPLYQQCYDKLKGILNDFTTLGDRLMACQQGSDEFDEVEKKIFARYRQVCADRSFDALRKQHDTLRAKLSVIKSRVASFDKRYQVDASSSD